MGSASLINGHIDDDTPSMTPQEAKAWFEEDLKDGKCSDDCPDCNARELAVKALEKQIPKKPIQARPPMCNLACAVCENVIPVVDERRKVEHCYKCGQALDWSNNDDK